MICWLMCVMYPRWAAIGASELRRASSSCAWPRAAIVPIVPMSCVLMRAASCCGSTPISACILRASADTGETPGELHRPPPLGNREANERDEDARLVTQAEHRVERHRTQSCTHAHEAEAQSTSEDQLDCMDSCSRAATAMIPDRVQVVARSDHLDERVGCQSCCCKRVA
jgi:hypothetical protein